MPVCLIKGATVNYDVAQARDSVMDDGHDGCEYIILWYHVDRLRKREPTRWEPEYDDKGTKGNLANRLTICDEAENQLPFVAFASWQETTKGGS